MEWMVYGHWPVRPLSIKGLYSRLPTLADVIRVWWLSFVGGNDGSCHYASALNGLDVLEICHYIQERNALFCKWWLYFNAGVCRGILLQEVFLVYGGVYPCEWGVLSRGCSWWRLLLPDSPLLTRWQKCPHCSPPLIPPRVSPYVSLTTFNQVVLMYCACLIRISPS